MISKEHISGIILTGGKSSRMGHDKASIFLNGKPFIQHVVEAMKPLVNSISIVSSNPEHDTFGVQRVEDLIEDAGPLAGLYSGLFNSSTPLNLVLSCDIPFIKTKTLELLLNEDYLGYDIVELSAKGKSMPLIALYKKNCATKCLELLNSDERRLRKLSEKCSVKTLNVEDNLIFQTQNINTKEDLKTILNEHPH